MRRFARISGIALTAVGLLTLVWVLVVWRWQDPLTGLYTRWQQHKLAQQLQHEFATQPGPRFVRSESLAAEARAIEQAAARFHHSARVGQAIGRIIIPHLGLNMVLVNGTDDSSLERGPGRDLRSFMPGQSRLVYIAGHRTTFLAPFSRIDQIQPGDRIRLEMPYGAFVYRASRHVIVPADDLGVLRSPRHELLALQACHPRFFATHRYIVYGHLVAVEPRQGRPLRPTLLAAAVSGRNRG
jgi:sortase A